jgi:hypothetical protein
MAAGVEQARATSMHMNVIITGPPTSGVPLPDGGKINGVFFVEQRSERCGRVDGDQEDDAHNVTLEDGLGIMPQVLDDLQEDGRRGRKMRRRS